VAEQVLGSSMVVILISTGLLKQWEQVFLLARKIIKKQTGRFLGNLSSTNLSLFACWSSQGCTNNYGGWCLWLGFAVNKDLSNGATDGLELKFEKLRMPLKV
jgi:hypothetical protein